MSGSDDDVVSASLSPSQRRHSKRKSMQSDDLDELAEYISGSEPPSPEMPTEKKKSRKKPRAPKASSRKNSGVVVDEFPDGPSENGLKQFVDWLFEQATPDEKPSIQIRLGSLFSGLDTGAICMDVLLAKMKEAYPSQPIEMNHVFACENDTKKIKQLKVMFPKLTHLYTDGYQVASGHARDEFSGKVVDTLGCDLLTAGFPCTSLSGLNACPKKFRNRKSASGGGWMCVSDYIKRHEPRVVVLENVLKIAQCRKIDRLGLRKPICPARQIVAAMRARGYVGGYQTVRTENYGLPQRRTRVYFVFVRGESKSCTATARSSPQPDGIAAKVFERLNTFACKPMALDKVLLQHPGVNAIAMSHHRQSGKKWKRRHDLYIAKHDLDADKINTMIRSEKFFGHAQMTPRIRSNVAIQFEGLRKMGIEPDDHGIVMQVDQSVDRVPTKAGQVPCVVPRGVYIVTNQMRLMLPSELMSAQGLSGDEQDRLGLSKLSGKTLQSLAGNMFSANVCCALLYSILLEVFLASK